MQVEFGQRILVWGNSCSGKSTLASQIAGKLGCPMVELDALNWLPDWVGLNQTDPARLEARMAQATRGHQWVVAGSYTAQAKIAIWPRLDMVIWLDLPRPLLLYRCLRRCWQRSRRKTLLWGTNQESFMQHLKVWQGEDSLLWWVFTQHNRKRRQTLGYIADGTWRDIAVVRITSLAQLRAFHLANGISSDSKDEQETDQPWDDTQADVREVASL